MPKGESNYANVEIDFFTDPRAVKMTDRAKLGYLAWWFTAIKERREWLLPHQSEPSTLAVRTGIGSRAVREGLISGQSAPGGPLLVLYPSGHVRVCGVRKKHKSLQFWHDDEDEELRGRLAPDCPAFARQSRASERNGTERRGAEQSAPLRLGQNSKSKISDADHERAFALLPESKRKKVGV